jgi:ABC-type sugar transport system substrate-binding protein
VGSVGSTAVFEPPAKMPRPKAGPPALERRPANVARLFCSHSLAAEISLRVAGMAAVKKNLSLRPSSKPSWKPSWKPRIALFLRQVGNEHQDMLRQDCRTAALRFGLIVNEDDARNDANVQIDQIRACLQASLALRPKALLVCPVEDSGLGGVAREAVRLGIAWVSLNRAYDYLAELRREFPGIAVFSVQPDQKEIGRIQAEQVRILLPSGGEVAYIRGPLRTVSANARDTSFRSALAGAAIHVTPLSADWSVEGGRQAAKTWLALAGRPKPEHCVIVAQNDSMAYGARLALGEAKPRSDLSKMPVIGCNGAPEFGCRLVSDQTLTATVVVPSPARCAVDMLAAVFAGGKPPSADITLTVSSFPEPSVLASAGRKAR